MTARVSADPRVPDRVLPGIVVSAKVCLLGNRECQSAADYLTAKPRFNAKRISGDTTRNARSIRSIGL